MYFEEEPYSYGYAKVFDAGRIVYRAPEELRRMTQTLSSANQSNLAESSVKLQYGLPFEVTPEVDRQTRMRFIVGGDQTRTTTEEPVRYDQGWMPYRPPINFKKFTTDDFEIGKRLGKGRFGDVYIAREKKTNYIVALKVLRKAEINRLNAEKLIVREIKVHSFLDHKNIIKLYGFFHDDHSIYLILEYAPDGELYQELKQSVC